MLLENFSYNKKLSAEKNFMLYLCLKAKEAGVTAEKGRDDISSYFRNGYKQAMLVFTFETEEMLYIPNIPTFVEKTTKLFLQTEKV